MSVILRKNTNMLKIAFFGTPEFIVEFLELLKKHNYTPATIVTGADVPVGRKLTLTSPAPKTWADTNNIYCLQPKKITEDFIENLKLQNFDLFIVIAYGKILPEKLINLPKYGTINVHYSLLPKYRGASPVEGALLAGETETGVCIQHMVYELDAGPILAQKHVLINQNDTHLTLRDTLNKEAFPLLLDVLKKFETNTIKETPQTNEGVSLTKKIKKIDGEVNLTENSTALWRKYQAYFGWPGVFFFDRKNSKITRIKITRAHMENGLFVIDTVIPEGRKEMRYEDYTRNTISN